MARKPEEELLQKEYRIVGLVAESFKRLQAVEIKPEPGDPLVVISGENEQGKSSVLDSIFATLDYANASKEIPRMIHGQDDAASIAIDLGDIIVTRKVTQKGTTLVVKGKEGFKFPSPQAVLDSLAGKMFDLSEFIERMTPAEQKKALLEVLNLPFDLNELEKEYKKVYEQRTETNRDLTKQKGHLSTLPNPKPGLPEKEVSTQELLDKMQEVTDEKAANSQKRTRLEGIKNQGIAKIQEIKDLEEEVKRLQDRMGNKVAEKYQLLESYNALKAEVAKLVDPDTAAIQEQLNSLEQTNRDIRNNLAYLKANSEVTRLEKESAALTNDLTEMDQRKADALKAANLPVEGLSFDEEGLVWDNAPFKQASTSAKLRVAFGMAVAKDPKIRVALCRGYQAFDKKNKALLIELARKHHFQIWAEMVEQVDPEHTGVIIEDGLVKEVIIPEKKQEPAQQDLSAIDNVASEFA